MKIFVGNLAFTASQADIQKLFEGFGAVSSAVIVMEKKEAKSRGFGFVEMPDDQHAGIAISSLNGQEFMGRSLNVSPARSKLELRPKKKKKEMNLNLTANIPVERSKEKVKRSFSRGSFFDENRGYKEGRRSRSYLERHKLSGFEEQFQPQRKNYANPMRWRKKQGQSKPWPKNQEGIKPGNKAGGEPKPGKKIKGEAKPWKKATGGLKPWKKDNDELSSRKKTSAVDLKPWRKNPGRPQRPSFRRHKTSGGPKGR
ncbi:MAG: RNA-binding protein [Candidatus Omnitrophota bacterium]